MKKITALLLPLALLFAAIAVFEFGAQYGASNTRAIALSRQLNNCINLYKQVSANADAPSKVNLEAVIDNYLVTAALERDAWYLRFKDEPKMSLDAALAEGLALRGDAVMQRFEAMQAATEGGSAQISSSRFAEIRTALEGAQSKLLLNQPPEPEHSK